MIKEKVLASGELNEAILLIEHVLENYTHLTEEEHKENLMFEYLGYNKFLTVALENIKKATTVFAELAGNESKKQDELIEGLIKATISPSEEINIKGDADLWINDTNTYNIATNNIVTWSFTDDKVIATLTPSSINGECTVTCKSNMALIGKIVTLTATLDTDEKYTKEITITSRI